MGCCEIKRNSTLIGIQDDGISIIGSGGCHDCRDASIEIDRSDKIADGYVRTSPHGRDVNQGFTIQSDGDGVVTALKIRANGDLALTRRTSGVDSDSTQVTLGVTINLKLGAGVDINQGCQLSK